MASGGVVIMAGAEVVSVEDRTPNKCAECDFQESLLSVADGVPESLLLIPGCMAGGSGDGRELSKEDIGTCKFSEGSGGTGPEDTGSVKDDGVATSLGVEAAVVVEEG